MDNKSQVDVQVGTNGRKVNGFSTPSGVANFLGIPYGSIPGRFRRSRLVDLEALETDLDATSYGPHCPQPKNLARNARAHLYEGTRPSTTTASELDCLNLNIYTPVESISSKSLPVLVWIHGGGFVMGDGGWEYDGNNLLQHSMRLGQPFVLVTLNYRLGYLGFLSSAELRAETEENDEKYVPNQGLYDQRLALEWVQRYIHHFGGDPSNVTIAGQSAGAWAAMAHALSNKPLCSKGLVMSSMAFSQQTDEEAQAVFTQLVESCGVTVSASAGEKLAALRSLTEDQMAELCVGKMLVPPTWDRTWFLNQESQVRLEHITNYPSWISGLMIGSTKHESAFLYKRWEPHAVEKLCQVLDASVKDVPKPWRVAEAYGIAPSKPRGEVLQGIIDFTTDAFFGLVPYYARQVEVPVNIFRFDQPDSLAGQEWAYHCLDTPHLFRLPAVAGPQAPESMLATSNIMAKSLLDFLHQRQPWTTFQESGEVMVFDGSKSGPVKVTGQERWVSCAETQEEEDSFVKAGLAFLTSRF